MWQPHLQEMLKFTPKIIVTFITKDPLKTLILCLQLVSLTTTIKGAEKILPSQVAYLFGGTVQFILLFLLIFGAAKEAPVRRWFSVVVLILISTYTSFFSFYNSLIEEKQKVMAAKAHRILVQKVYTPIEDHLSEVQARLQNYEKEIKREVDGQGQTGFPGFGDKARELAKENKKDEEQARILNDKINKIKPLFTHDISKKTPQEIFQSDQEALGSIGKDFSQQQKIEIVEISRKDYLILSDQGSDEAEFLIPYNKIRKLDLDAIASLIMASIIDGLTLILGSAIEHRSSNMFGIISHFCSSFILGFKKTFHTIQRSLRKEVGPFKMPEADGLSDTVRLVISLGNGKGSDFICKFHDAVDQETHVIDIENLISQENNPNFKRGYRLLFNTMCCRPLRWIEALNPSQGSPYFKFGGLGISQKKSNGNKNTNGFRISAKHFPDFIEWTLREAENQASREETTVSTRINIEMP